MRKKYLWNKVFKKLMEIKDEFLKTNSDINYNELGEFNNILELMVNGIKNDAFRKEALAWLNTLKISQLGSFVLLHYDLIESAEAMWKDINHINIEARSIVVDLKEEAIVICPMPKFFNIDEIPENSFENVIKRISNSEIFEVSDKLDGSNQNASFYNGKIVLCGSQACDPEKSWRVVEGYKFIEQNEGYSNMLKDYPDETFCFEFIHPLDIHIVSYDETKAGLYLFCMRNNLTGKMSSYKEAQEVAIKYGVPFVDIEQYSFDELLNLRDKYSSNDKEGWVLNIDGYRIKFKTEDYLNMHKAFSNRSISKLLIKEIADGTVDDFISTVPVNSKEKILELMNYILEFIEKERKITLAYYDLVKDIEDQKEFAMAVMNKVEKNYRSYIFNLRKGEDINYLKRGLRYLSVEEIGIENLYLKFPK